MFNWKAFLNLCCLFLVPLFLLARQDTMKWHDRLNFTATGGAAIPRAGLSHKYDRLALSYSFSLGYQVSLKHYTYIDLTISGHRLARYRNIFPVQSPQGGLFDLNHTTRSNLMNFHLGGTHEFDQFWYVIPRVSFSFGVTNGYVYTSLKDNSTDEIIDSYRQANDWSYLMAISGGLNIPVIPGLHVSILTTYHRTGSMDLFLPRTMELTPSPVDPFDNFELRRSASHLLSFQIGVTLYFYHLPH